MRQDHQRSTGWAGENLCTSRPCTLLTLGSSSVPLDGAIRPGERVYIHLALPVATSKQIEWDTDSHTNKPKFTILQRELSKDKRSGFVPLSIRAPQAYAVSGRLCHDEISEPTATVHIIGVNARRAIEWYLTDDGSESQLLF